VVLLYFRDAGSGGGLGVEVLMVALCAWIMAMPSLRFCWYRVRAIIVLSCRAFAMANSSSSGVVRCDCSSGSSTLSLPFLLNRA